MAKNKPSKKPKQLKTLDLHGYKSDEVEAAIDKFLMSLNNISRARIMTGKGKGVVQKIAIDYLKHAGYPWEYETLDNGKKNTGALIIFC